MAGYLTEKEVVTKLLLNGILKKDGEKFFFTSEAYFGTSNKVVATWIADSHIPFRIKMDNGATFVVTGITDYVRKYITRLLSTGDYSYERIVDVTKAFYADTRSPRPTINNFCKQGILLGLLSQDPKVDGANGDFKRVG